MLGSNDDELGFGEEESSTPPTIPEGPDMDGVRDLGAGIGAGLMRAFK